MTSISADGATQYVSLRWNTGSSLVEYTTDQSTWFPIPDTAAWPVTITNTNPGASSVLIVKVINNLFISSGYGDVSGYLNTGSTYIRYDGSGNTIRFDGITNYPGFIRNGGYTSGNANITVQNFITAITGGTTLNNDAGWLCQQYFGSGAPANLITGCTNNCPVNQNNTGGITGGSSGTTGGSLLTISYCTNNGIISGQNSGGITPYYVGHNGGSIRYEHCTNNGAINGNSAGGIAAGQSGSSGGTAYFGYCTNNGIINSNNGGGISGPNAGDGGSVTFEYCTNTGPISSSNSGGIAGTYVGQNSTGAIFTGCTNTGNLNGSGTGGITGQYSGTNCPVTFTNCTNSGIIYGDNAGGIAAQYCAINPGAAATFSGCINTGDISGNYAGGINGQALALNPGSTASFTNCYSTGNITGSYAGGISGGNAGNNGTSVSYTNCFSTGNILGNFSGGIVGSESALGVVTFSMTNCYSTGSISGNACGGLTGSNIGTNSSTTPVINISNCYSLGAIATNTGGIIGAYNGGGYTNTPIITISNCYSYGAITPTGQGIVGPGYSFTPTQTNCYAANGTWSDATANTNLTGLPSGVGLSNKGASWASYPSANTPYLLSFFLSYPIYDPSSAITSSQFYNVLPDITLGGSYTLASIEVLGQVATTQVLNILSTTPYYGYYGGVFTLTNTRAFEDVSVLINSSTGNISYAYNFTDPCFLEGTKILCFKNNQEIYRPIESLRKGDLVKTIYNGYMPINMICTSVLYNPGNDHRITNRLYKCSKERYPELFEDLYITGCHSILLPWLTDEQWELTKAVNGDVFVTDNHFRLIAYADELAEPFNKEGYMNIYHVALDHHDEYMNYGIYANGLLVESCSIDCLIYSGMKELGENDSIVAKNMSVNNADNISQIVGAC